MGCVVDSRQDYIWKRGGRKTGQSSPAWKIPSRAQESRAFRRPWRFFWARRKIYGDVEAYLAQGYTPYEILEEQSAGRVLDLSGCSVSMVQYYVSQGYPVLALQGGGAAELITGYDQQNIIVTDPADRRESSRRGLNDSTQMYEELGNLFLVCLPAKEA